MAAAPGGGRLSCPVRGATRWQSRQIDRLKLYAFDLRDSFSKFNVDKLVKLARIYDADLSGGDLRI